MSQGAARNQSPGAIQGYQHLTNNFMNTAGGVIPPQFLSNLPGNNGASGLMINGNIFNNTGAPSFPANFINMGNNSQIQGRGVSPYAGV